MKRFLVVLLVMLGIPSSGMPITIVQADKAQQYLREAQRYNEQAERYEREAQQSSELLAILLGNIGVSETVYGWIHALIPPLKWASLAYALYFVGLNFVIGYILYRKKIYIKL